MGERRRRKLKSHLGIIIAALFVILLIYFAVQIFGRAQSAVSTIKNQFVTDHNYITLHGYVYRDEELICISDNELAELTVPSGEKIPVGKEYMKLYETNISLDVQRALVQAQLNDIEDRIDALASSVTEELRVQDISQVNSDLAGSYYAFISSVSDNNYPAASADGERLLDLMNKQQIITGKLATLKDSLSDLGEQKTALLNEYITGGTHTVNADKSCYVYRSIDGYEGSFAYADVMNMTVEEFRATINGAESRYDYSAVAKRVYSSRWYLAVPITETNAQIFEVGSTYDIILSEIGDTSTPMRVERIEIPEGSRSGFMVLSSGEIDKSFQVSRYTSISFLKTSTSGYRIPESALCELDFDDDGFTDYTGVYVMSGNYVKFRRIHIISYGDGYVIAREGDDEDDGDGEQRYPYLSGNELIIVSGGNLYDGKLIK